MIKVKLIRSINYSDLQVETINKSAQVMETVINSNEFKDKVLNFELNGDKTFSYKRNPFKSFEIYTNVQVYQLIMQAHEINGNIEDGIIELYLKLEKGDDGKNIGYGLPTDEWIHTYESFFNAADEFGLANHLTHEWCHKIGFEHSKYKWQDTNRDESSVPYAIGNLVEIIAKQLI
jgi:hypothetical protein